MDRGPRVTVHRQLRQPVGAPELGQVAGDGPPRLAGEVGCGAGAAAHRPPARGGLTHGADPLHLTVVFDLDESTAIRYAASARQLLERPHGGGPVAWPRTKAALGDNACDEHSGSR